MTLTHRPNRKHLEEALWPKCLRCQTAIRCKPRWQRHGWLCTKCEPLCTSESIDTIRRRYIALRASGVPLTGQFAVWAASTVIPPIVDFDDCAVIFEPTPGFPPEGALS